MAIESLKANTQTKKELTAKLEQLNNQLAQTQNAEEKKNLESAIGAIEKQIGILNQSVPELIENVSLVKKLPEQTSNIQTPPQKIIGIAHNSEEDRRFVAIRKSDKMEYLKQLQISETSLKNLKRKTIREDIFSHEYKKANKYIRISNQVFGKMSNKMVRNGKFDRLKLSLRKGNFMILVNSYVSMMFFTTFLSVFFALAIIGFFMIFGLFGDSSIIYIASMTGSDILRRLLMTIWLLPAIPALTFLLLYIYPSTEQASIGQQINFEMPFATIQMSAIAGANIEPTNIFRIIALNKEYPNIRNESKKLMNQINLYGYDLTNALKNVADSSPSKQWADLLNGFSTIIRSGGDLALYLQKRAETLLFEYRLQREKATKAAETFMDIYISVVIAAPMLLMLLLIMLNISQIGMGLSTPVLTLVIVSVVATINVFFLIFLHMKKSSM